MANLLSNPRKWKNKVILVKLETGYAVDAIPTGAANWIEARNVVFTPMDTDKVSRNIELPYMGSSGSVPVGFWVKLAFDVAMVGSGVAGTPAKYGPLLLACGTSETVVLATSVGYNLVSSAFPSICAYINIDGTLHKAYGGRGEVKGKMSAKGTPMMSFAFDFLYVAPVTDGLPAVMRTGWPIEQGINSINTSAATIDGQALAFSTLDWSFGNKVERIDLPGPQLEIGITDRTPQASIVVLAPDLAVFDPFALVQSAATVPFDLTHGSVAGKKVATAMQVCVVGVDYDQIDGQAAYKLMLEPVPVAGNDEIALTCL